MHEGIEYLLMKIKLHEWKTDSVATEFLLVNEVLSSIHLSYKQLTIYNLRFLDQLSQMLEFN